MNAYENVLSWPGKNGEINYFVIKKVELLNYIGDFDMLTADLILYLAKDVSNNVINTIVFKNVRSIRFNLSKIQLTGLAIDDISNRGLEKCNYWIHTYESDDIDFNCEDIEIISNAT